MKPTLLGIIPARYNSRRLPGKNLRILGDKPLIVHTIECALKCDSIDRLIVSTDSPVLKDISLNAKAEVPFLRPPELATETATTKDVVFHAVQFLKEQENRVYDYFLVLQPTSPLRTPADIEQAFQLLLAAKADSIVSVSASLLLAAHLVITDNGFIKSVTDDQVFSRELSFYQLNGAIYISRMEILLETGCLLGEKIIPYFMPESRSIDIDTPEDLLIAATFLEKGKTFI